MISSGVGVSRQKQTIAIKIEPFIEGATEPLALPAKETKDVELISRNLEKLVKIGSGLQEPLRTSLIELLRVYADIFACVPSDMPGIDEKMVVHKLCIDPARKLVRQKRRISVPERPRMAKDL